MAEALPLHPGGGSLPDAPTAAGPGPELRARRERIVRRLGRARFSERCRTLSIEAARATLQLTGQLPDSAASEAEIRAGREGNLAAAPAFRAPLAALRRLEQAAGSSEADGRDPTAPLLGEIHAIATGEAGPSSFRASQIEPQFSGAGLSPPQTIPLRLGELLTWISGQSGRDLETAPRAALFFARFLDISPFVNANFRVAHLMLSFFALADEQPPIWFDAGDAPGIRDEVSRAFRFDTGPLTARIERALERSLSEVAKGG